MHLNQLLIPLTDGLQRLNETSTANVRRTKDFVRFDEMPESLCDLPDSSRFACSQYCSNGMASRTVLTAVDLSPRGTLRRRESEATQLPARLNSRRRDLAFLTDGHYNSVRIRPCSYRPL
jgi:hypothetical protein